MWIQERYFATSKKGESLFRILLSAGFLVLSGLSLTGCIVTDTIEFDEATNHPPAVVESTPRGIHSTCPGNDASFFVIVEDVDEDDANDTDMQGMLSLINEIDSIAPYPCDDPRPPLIPISSDPEDSDGDRTLIQITCPISAELLAQIPYEVLTSVHLEVSDLGYVSGNTPREDAYVVQVDWVLEVERCE
jgi:hypothetical protein